MQIDIRIGRWNDIFRRNGGRDEIVYAMDLDIEQTLSVTAGVRQAGYQEIRPAKSMGKGMRSIYMLSLLEAYEEDGMKNADIIMVEDPEIFLHPKLQKVSWGYPVQAVAEEPGALFHPFPEPAVQF